MKPAGLFFRRRSAYFNRLNLVRSDASLMARLLLTASAVKLSLVAALSFPSIQAQAAKPLPPEVQASIDAALKDCKEKPVFKKGFLARRDINGDGVEDFILDFGLFSCGDAGSLYCGTAGCTTTVFASLPNGKYATILDENVRAVEFKRVRGRPAMLLGLHGSACGRTGAEPCGATLYWNGAKFSPAH